MSYLTAHLCRPDDHGRLAFHPECPLCRGERLAGALPAEPVLGRRTPALLAAGALVFSSATPAAVLAQEPVQDPRAATVTEPNAPELDPGEERAVPIDAAPPAPVLPDSPAADTIPLEPEADDDVPEADLGDEPSAGDGQAPAVTDPAPAPAPTEPAPAPPNATTVTAPVATAAEPQADATSRARKRERAPRVTTHTLYASPAPRAKAVNHASAPVSTTVSQELPVPTTPAVATPGRASQRGDRVHAVQRGESLWSIAGDLLGAEASAAQIAREVNRLWELNRDRIATGDRDLLMVGTRLALR